jgi:hypothetical protein
VNPPSPFSCKPFNHIHSIIYDNKMAHLSFLAAASVITITMAQTFVDLVLPQAGSLAPISGTLEGVPRPQDYRVSTGVHMWAPGGCVADGPKDCSS